LKLKNKIKSLCFVILVAYVLMFLVYFGILYLCALRSLRVPYCPNFFSCPPW
jgi:hypothetical protein